MIQAQTSYNSQNINLNSRNQPIERDSSSPFPAGYVPPHLAKQTVSSDPLMNGLNSSEQSRMIANQSKKEKLKMAKQMLKMGYSPG